jgi:hypothetical protein
LTAAGSAVAAKRRGSPHLIELIASAHERSDTSGPRHRDTLAARNQFAYWTGDAAGARDLLAAMLSVTQESLGVAHPEP